MSAMAKELTITLMVTCMKETGVTTKNTEKESTSVTRLNSKFVMLLNDYMVAFLSEREGEGKAKSAVQCFGVQHQLVNV